MNRTNESIKACVVTLFVTAALVAGCNTSTGTTGGAYPPGSNNAASSVRHDTVATQKIHIHDDGDNGTFIGKYTPEPCWTVSPHPLPTYGEPETKTFWVSYDSAGCSKRNITIIYYSQGYGSNQYNCNYLIKYPISGPWSYSTQNGNYTTCSVASAPPSKNYDEDFYFAIVVPKAHSHRR
jgi:hypothetical protein